MFFYKKFLLHLIYIPTFCSFLFACAGQGANFSTTSAPLEYKNDCIIIDLFNRAFTLNFGLGHGGELVHRTYSSQRETKQNKSSAGTGKQNGAKNNKQAIPLLLSLQEISRNDYKEKYGQDSLESDPVTAVAENLAKVTLNKIVLEKDKLKPGDLLSIRTFNTTDYIVIIDNITYGSRVLSIIGKIGKTDYGYLNLSVADNLVLASLNLTELNSIYLLRYNHYSGNYYLFEAPYDKIEKPVRY